MTRPSKKVSGPIVVVSGAIISNYGRSIRSQEPFMDRGPTISILPMSCIKNSVQESKSRNPRPQKGLGRMSKHGGSAELSCSCCVFIRGSGYNVRIEQLVHQRPRHDDSFWSTLSLAPLNTVQSKDS